VRDEFRAAKVGGLVVEVLTALLPGPAILVVDDAHSADAASAEVLAQVAAATPNRPWLLLVAGRATPPALASAAAETVTVEPLADADARALVIASGGETLAPHVVRSVVARAQGNPLFVRELTAAVARSGADELPDTLEELLAAEIDALAPPLRQLVRVAAVLGQRVDDELLGQLLDDDGGPRAWPELDRFFGTDANGERAFRTKLLRDSAYEGLPYRRRMELHGRAATAIAARAAGREADVAESLSLHTLAAGRYDDAWRYSMLAGERARAMYAHTEALVFFGRARTAAARLANVAAEDLAGLLEAIGNEHARLAELQPALTAYQEARRRGPAAMRLLRARVALSAGLAAERAGARTRAARWLGIAQREATSPDTADVAARVRVERAFLRYTTGHDADAAALCRQAIAEAERIRADDVVGRALHLLDLVDLRAGRGSDEQRVRRALTLFERCGDLSRQAGLWNHLGMAAYFRGDWDAAVAHYRQAQTAHERSGDEWSAAIASANIGEILVDQGRLDEAEPLVAEALRVWRVSGTSSDIGFGAALLGRLVARRGRYAEALALLGEAETAYAAKDELAELTDVALRHAEALLLHGAAAQALAQVDRADARLRAALRMAGRDPTTLPALPVAAAMLRLRGCATVQLGQYDDATRILDESVVIARRANSAHELALALSARAWADGSASDEAGELFATLGIAWTPALPRTASALLPVQRPEPPVRTNSSADLPAAT
jgi:tetratricopeptide (TPR) repeat protein